MLKCLLRARQKVQSILHDKMTTYQIMRTTAMAFNPRAMSSGHFRQASASDNLNPAMSASVSLQTRVHEKKEELENLKQLRDLSAAVASQMEALEQKLSTLTEGTEGTQLELFQAAGGYGRLCSDPWTD